MASSENLCLKAFPHRMKYQHLKKPKCLLIVLVWYLKCLNHKLHIDLQIAIAGVSKLGTNVAGYQSTSDNEVDATFSCDRIDLISFN